MRRPSIQLCTGGRRSLWSAATVDFCGSCRNTRQPPQPHMAGQLSGALRDAMGSRICGRGRTGCRINHAAPRFSSASPGTELPRVHAGQLPHALTGRCSSPLIRVLVRVLRRYCAMYSAQPYAGIAGVFVVALVTWYARRFRRLTSLAGNSPGATTLQNFRFS